MGWAPGAREKKRSGKSETAEQTTERGEKRERKMFGFDRKRGTKRCLYASLLGLLYVYTHTRVTPTPEDVTCVSSDFWYS